MIVFGRIVKILWRSFVAITLLLVLVLIGFSWAASSRETAQLGTLPEQGGRLVATTEGDIYILERGDPTGTPVLFAHGTAAWSGLWLPTLETVGAQSYHAIGYDLPPFGYSQHSEDGD